MPDGLCAHSFTHLGTQLLLDNDVLDGVLPQHFLPPQPGGQRGRQAWWLAQLHWGDLGRLCKGHHDDLCRPYQTVWDQGMAAVVKFCYYCLIVLLTTSRLRCPVSRSHPFAGGPYKQNKQSKCKK